MAAASPDSADADRAPETAATADVADAKTVAEAEAEAASSNSASESNGRSRSRSPRRQPSRPGVSDTAPTPNGELENPSHVSGETASSGGGTKRSAAEMNTEDAEMAAMEAEWKAEEAKKKAEDAAAAAAAAARKLARRRHSPPLFRDADGDQANEFWEESPKCGGMLRPRTDGLKEIFLP
eukprot:TRINITY_DN2525_c0_g2_i1.p1 TRINITY_DN2525_c0_g2~~TRINITY_DN2525_c0_g2_i1.p1  ORF type:complete len:181 (-),score=50.33 TRINITY_DN2525_c0_g2_i1:390-932(-)